MELKDQDWKPGGFHRAPDRAKHWATFSTMCALKASLELPNQT